MAPKIRRQSIDSRNAPIKPSINIIINADAIIRPIISVRIVSNNVVAGNSGSTVSIIINDELLSINIDSFDEILKLSSLIIE